MWHFRCGSNTGQRSTGRFAWSVRNMAYQSAVGVRNRLNGLGMRWIAAMVARRAAGVVPGAKSIDTVSTMPP
jgi:hypothetical protein